MENYFNYFTEIEEYFWTKRGAHILVSPLDWAIIEMWKETGVPLEVVLKGIDRAFERYAARGKRARPIKSLAYCVDAVADVVEEAREAAVGASALPSRPASYFSAEEVRAYLERNRQQLGSAAEHATAAGEPELAARIRDAANSLGQALGSLPLDRPPDLEDLERRLTLLEEKLYAALLANTPEEMLLEIRRDMDRSLSPYRRKMTAGQLSLLEKQYLQKRLFDRSRLPRLSLFYLG